MSRIEKSMICQISGSSVTSTANTNTTTITNANTNTNQSNNATHNRDRRLVDSSNNNKPFLGSPLRFEIYRMEKINEKQTLLSDSSLNSNSSTSPNDVNYSDEQNTTVKTAQQNMNETLSKAHCCSDSLQPIQHEVSQHQQQATLNYEEGTANLIRPATASCTTHTVEQQHLELSAVEPVAIPHGSCDNSQMSSKESLYYAQLNPHNTQVEPIHGETGHDVVVDMCTLELATLGTSQSESNEETSSQIIATAVKLQEPGLKPILKRKDQSSERCAVLPIGSSLPPPILKKRDSFNDLVSSAAPASKDINVLSATQQQSAKPASILKNRQKKGSYSFDENFIASDSSVVDDSSVHHLKPILKKKSWSIEEKVPQSSLSSVQSSECVRGILKSTDTKLTAASSLSSFSTNRNSITDDISTLGSTQSSQRLSSKVTLKSILKTTSKSSNSASISSSSSSDSIIDDFEAKPVLSSPQLVRSAILQQASMEEESIEKMRNLSEQMKLVNNGSSQIQDEEAFDMPSSSSASSSSSTSSSASPVIEPFLKRTIESDVQASYSQSDSLPLDDCCNPELSPNASPPLLDQNSATIESSPEQVDSNESSVSSKSADEFSSMDTLTVITRRKLVSGDGPTPRPKSCFVTSEFFDQQMSQCSSLDDDQHNLPGNNFIRERLALLRKNGQEGWKHRVHKSDAATEITANLPEVRLRPKLDDTPTARGSVIANRLSSLMESQSQWKNRVGESDAKQFTVSSKLSFQTDSLHSGAGAGGGALNESSQKMSDKPLLRDTPKRIGLRGSTLNESALSAVSAKLNNVLRPDKSLLSSPLSPSKKKADSGPLSSSERHLSILDESEQKKSKVSSETVYLSRPDDEESFGSFFGIDKNALDQLISVNELSDKPLNQPGSFTLDSISSDSTKLLSDFKKTRIQVPKRRAASSHNPIKQLNQSAIALDSYTYNKVPSVQDGRPTLAFGENCKSASKVDKLASSSSSNNANLALSALAGLASKEDFKSVASKLRNSSTVNASSDSWRAYDLKNSMQTKMLLLIKGRRHAQVRLVKPSWRNLNPTDSFILVSKDSVYAFIGPFSNIIERTKCIEVAEHIRKRKDLCYRASSNDLILIDGHVDTTKANLFERMKSFLQELNLTQDDHSECRKLLTCPNTSMDRCIDEEDECYEESMIGTNMIYNALLVETAKAAKVELVPVEKYWGRSPRHLMLQPELVFLLDFGTEMYVWIGKNVSNSHRKLAVEAAKELWLKGYDYSELDYSPFGTEAPLKSDKRPEWSWFTRANQNMEPITLKEKFFSWPAFTLTRSVKKKTTHSFSSSSSSSTPNSKNNQVVHSSVKKDLSQELNIFPVDAQEDMIDKKPTQPNLVLENVSLGRGAGDIIKDEDGLSVKINSLEVQCFFIDETGNRVELVGADRNFLCTGESYYIRWKYRLTRISRSLKTGGESRFSEQHGGRDRLCYFVWQGKHARNTQRGATALNAIDKLREEGAFQVSINNGQEEPAFLRIFEGKLVIQLGKRSQVADNSNYRMFSLMSSLVEETFLVELECSNKNLRSRSSFILINLCKNKIIYIWHGCKSSTERREMTKKILHQNILHFKSAEFGFTPDSPQFEVVEIEEGHEDEHFRNIFARPSTGNSPRRASRVNLQRDLVYFSLIDDGRQYNFTPRLFQFITLADIFQVVEIIPAHFCSVKGEHGPVFEYPFSQDDLYHRAKERPTFFLLDNHYEVYLWESKFPFHIFDTNLSEKTKDDVCESGPALPSMIDIASEIQSEANTITGSLTQLWLAERKCSLETTLAYCHAKNKSEPPKAYVISAGLEPDSFCALFPTWTYYEQVAQLHIQDGRKPGQQILVQEVLAQIRDVHASSYSYEVLTGRPLPEGINILCLESYLDDTEFEKVFGFNREEFYSLPTWKQKSLKQEKGLF